MQSKPFQKIEYPQINPVPKGVHRPFWSVMIPTYNCAKYLTQTLESVLSQDPGPEHMQIEVVDDCSTKDDPEAVVREIGKGRVSFYRQPQNVGAIRNFNTCVQRSQGQIVHILHGDDFVGTGFYECFSQMINAYPDVNLFACRVFQVDEQGEIDNISPRLKSIESPNNDASLFFYGNSFYTPAVVIRRKFYEEFGGFYEFLKHTADWEMWVRTIKKSSGLAINKPLAYYRFFTANDSSKLARSGDNLRDWLFLGNIFSLSYKEFDNVKFTNSVKTSAFAQAINFMHSNDKLAARNNTLLWWELLSNAEKVSQLTSMVINRDKARLKIMLNLL
jgi:glycosyltransferase involved in cell wall biosynthesis